ncbi:MAG TPA: DEAD/DEAH box helicase [Saprospiraceae bacterium]|nr:DEAD/DEAH box helicase [Saprospiraceae bacterium]
MTTFHDLNLNKGLQKGIDDIKFSHPTPIQEQTFSTIRSGKNVVGIAQTGTGKTLAYLLPVLQDLKYADQLNPRVLILVPTRELVTQVVEQVEIFTKYLNLRVLGVFGGTNINTQKLALSEGVYILVATPGRLYDLALTRALQLKGVSKLIIDEVDVMLDLGFRFQLTNIFELLPEKRQNIMFSATMTEEVDELIDSFFIDPVKISIAVSGTPLENIKQTAYPVPNFYTKANLLMHFFEDKETFAKVLVFTPSKKTADLLFDTLSPRFGEEMGVIHSNKPQNYRFRTVRQFDEGVNRILISTDVMARGLDLEKISHVINFDTPIYPENYMHRIGRTGRATNEGNSILLYTEQEEISKLAIEILMNYEIPTFPIPEGVEISSELTPDEKRKPLHGGNSARVARSGERGESYHEKKDKNKKVNLGGSYRREIAVKYKKPKTRGDKFANNKKKKR